MGPCLNTAAVSPCLARRDETTRKGVMQIRDAATPESWMHLNSKMIGASTSTAFDGAAQIEESLQQALIQDVQELVFKYGRLAKWYRV
jgi:hypothetical protein